MEYFIWSSRRISGHCVLLPAEIEDEWEFDDGIPQLDKLDDELVCEFDPDYPNDLEIVGNMYGAGMPVVSQTVCDLLQAAISPNCRVEYIPIQIKNHKGRLLEEEFFILHPLVLCDCIDREKSGIEWNQISKDLISCCNGLVFDESKIPNDLAIFRLKHWGEKIIVRSDVVVLLENAGVTGLHFISTNGYTGMP